MSTPDPQELKATALNDAVERLVREFAPRAVYLFGSRAYGTPHRYSDFDLLIVGDFKSSDKYALNRRAFACLHGLKLPIELHFCRPATLERFATVTGSFYKDAKERGKIVYAA